jgi:hypothetical protein
MTKAQRKPLFFAVAIGFLLFALLLWRGSRNPSLTVTYLGLDEPKGWMARFAITNVGNAAAIIPSFGQIELSGLKDKVRVACRPNVQYLLPGEGDVVFVTLPEEVQGQWRFTYFYGRKGIASRLAGWRARPKVRRWIPAALAVQTVDLSSSSKWIDD